MTWAIILALRLSCSRARGSYPDQGWIPCLLLLQADLYHSATREVPLCIFVISMNVLIHPIATLAGLIRDGEVSERHSLLGF